MTARPPPSEDDGLEDLLGLCLDAAESEGEAAVAKLLAAHPRHAERLKKQLALLRDLGMLGEPAAEAAAERPPVERLGDFRLLSRIGAGGMGVVWLAEQESLGRRVALKLLPPAHRLAGSAAVRFRREAQAIARLSHPNIVAVHAVGEQDGLLYIAMELVDGTDLSAMALPLPTADVLRIGRDLAQALACAHAAGIVHRDVKPSNVKLRADGRAMLLDFGLAQDEHRAALTQAGTFQGSPDYASPEQVAGRALGPVSDVWSLGATLYECVTGSPPFRGGSTQVLFQQILTADPVPPRRRNPQIPRDLETVLLQALEKDPARRYPDARAFADDLQALLEFRPIAARPPTAFARLYRLARRHALATTALAAAVATVLLLLVVQGAGRSAELDDAIATAQRALDGFVASADREDDLLRELEALEARHLGSGEIARLERSSDAIDALIAERNRQFLATLAALSVAERLAPGGAPAAAIRSKLFLQRWREAKLAHDERNAGIYASIVAAEHGGPKRLAAVQEHGRFWLRTVPEHAEVWLFGYRELAELRPGGDHRLVPVPHGTMPPVAAGGRVLRVRAPLDGLDAEDLVLALDGHPLEHGVPVTASGAPGVATAFLLAIDGERVDDCGQLRELDVAGGKPHEYTFAGTAGAEIRRAESLAALGLEPCELRAIAAHPGARALVLHRGRSEERQLPASIELRTTAAPLVPGPDTALVTPIEAMPIESGCTALLRAPGYLDQRIAIPAAGDVHLAIELQRQGTAPPGFVAIAGATVERPFQAVQVIEPFWIQEYETTCGEYLAFLDDPATLAEIKGSDRPVRFPRTSSAPGATSRWPQEGPHYQLPPDVRADWPVTEISWDDAVAYARWRTAGDPDFAYALPTVAQWTTAARGPDLRAYPFGERFRARWVKSTFARRAQGKEPVGTFPIDESPFGVFDLAGSVREWCDGRVADDDVDRPYVGGSFGSGIASLFRIDPVQELPPESVGAVIGFRLVATRKPR